jgi:translation initiation factor IF-3
LNTNKNITKDPAALINENIKADKLQVIAADGENVGVISRGVALQMAREASLELVLLAEQGKEGFPVAKIMDFGKVLYAKKKKKSEAKKHQKVIQVKEIKIRPKIGDNDYQTKIKQAIQFLLSGKRVKITLWFKKGRESVTREDRGAELFDRIDKSFEDQGFPFVHEQDAKSGLLWSRIYYIKNDK